MFKNHRSFGPQRSIREHDIFKITLKGSDGQETKMSITPARIMVRENLTSAHAVIQMALLGSYYFSFFFGFVLVDFFKYEDARSDEMKYHPMNSLHLIDWASIYNND